MKAQGFIFDLDGVLTDTAEYHYRSWKRLADELGIPFSREENEALRGLPRRDSLELLLKGRAYPEAQLAAMMDRKNNYYRAYLEQMTPADLLPGVADFLDNARAAGIQLGLGSASRNARDVCLYLGILDYFTAFADGHTMVKAKPAPDIFLWVADRLRLDPQACIVFEDAEAGVAAALAGGFWTVGIGPAERVGAAQCIIAGLHQHTIEDFSLPLA